MKNTQITLQILKDFPKGLSAYEILDKFQSYKKAQPTTVYRSLDALINEGVVHKSISNKKFMLCNHNHKHDHNTLLAICKICGNTEELLKEFFLPITKIKKLSKFDLSFFDLEILTKCKACK